MEKPRNLRVLSALAPMTQLNAPYPSTACLTGFLRSRGVEAAQEDFALGTVLKLFSREGLRAIRESAGRLPAKKRTASVKSFLSQFDRYADAIEAAVAFRRRSALSQ